MSSPSQKYNKQKLLELQRFVLDRKTTNTRIELYEHMVATAIFKHSGISGTVTYDDLKKKIGDDFGIKKIPDIHLREAIANLSKENALSKINSKLTLSQVKRNEIKKNIREICELEDKIRDSIFESLHEKIPSISDQQCRKIIENLVKLLGVAFAKYGSTSARILTEGINKISELKNQDGFQLHYEKLILTIVSKDVRNALDEFFNEYFGNPSEEVARFLFSRAQSYVYFEILNLDPDLKSLEKKSWSQKQIYLDTNTFMDLIFEGSVFHDAVETLVNETRELGAKILITEKTGDEFLASIENASNKHKNFRVNPKFAMFYENAQKQGQFLSTYSNELIKNANLSMSTFLKRYQEFEILMESKYGIVLEEVDERIDLECEIAQRLKTQIYSHATHKQPKVVEHDAYMILHVHELRDSKPDITGPKAWMLTTDHSLSSVERAVYGKKSVNASVIPEIWLEIISPFVSPQVTINDRSYAFTKLLSSNFTSHKIPLTNLSTLLSAFWNTEGIDEKHLEIIIGNDFIREKLSQIQKSIDKGGDPPTEKIEPILHKGLELIKEDFDQKLNHATGEHKQEMKSMQKKVDELNDIVKDLKVEKTQAEKKVKTTKSTYTYVILAIVGSAIIDALLYFALTADPDFDVGHPIVPVLLLLTVQVPIVFKIIKR